MVTKAQKPRKNATTSTSKSDVAKLQANGVQTESMDNILRKIEKLENLKKYYGRLKTKHNSLKETLNKIKTSKSSKSDKFEEDEINEFPFAIVLKGIGQYERMEEIFTINQPETVENFTEYLLKQVDEILEVFKKDLQEHTRNLVN